MGYERYSRQILFSEIGEKGQRLLSNASVLILGCGALGTVSANHLVRATFCKRSRKGSNRGP